VANAPKEESPRARLKAVRDQLATAVPRLRARGGVSRELLGRLEAALERASSVYLLCAATQSGAVGEAIEEALEDALVEAHLALHEAERAGVEDLTRPKPRAPVRRAERHDTNVTVKLLRHNVRGDSSSGVSLDQETAQRQARNVSMSGIFVSLPKDELPEVQVNSVVHVSVALGADAPFKARAIVRRREPDGIGLSWIQDSDRVKRAVEALLDAVRRAGKPF
jgi:hypothetical protein